MALTWTESWDKNVRAEAAETAVPQRHSGTQQSNRRRDSLERPDTCTCLVPKGSTARHVKNSKAPTAKPPNNPIKKGQVV